MCFTKVSLLLWCVLNSLDDFSLSFLWGVQRSTCPVDSDAGNAPAEHMALGALLVRGGLKHTEC
jgi:hypothetical protein